MLELSDVSKHYAHGDLTEANSGLPVKVLRAFGDSVSRVNVLKQATSLEGSSCRCYCPA